MRTPKIAVGEKYGRWTVTHIYQHEDTTQTWASVTCDCGKKTQALGYWLTSGRSKGCKSCGAKARVYDFDQQKFELSCINDIYHNYKSGTRRGRDRVIEFDLSQNHFAALIKDSCKYCDAPPSNVKRRKKTGHEFKYSGIDRKNNDAGYVEGNVVACCWTCNRMKGNMTYDEFIAHVARINQRHPEGSVLVLAR